MTETLYICTYYDDRGPEDDQDPPKHVASVNNLLNILKKNVVLTVDISL